MKYAIVNNQKVEADKGLKGFCPICQQPVIAKCGTYKINPWAHKSIMHCDKWWENETEWHRQWKDTFPKEWQEIVSIDEKTGEKHIADIQTSSGMVVEFQHSNISEEERISRENFYKNMIWIVDGTRRKRDFEHFHKAFEEEDIWHTDEKSPFYVLELGRFHLPKEWLNSSVPVFFDFKGLLDKNIEEYDNNPYREPLPCLLPIRSDRFNVLIPFDRNKLIKMIKERDIAFKNNEICNAINQAILRRYGRIRLFH